MTAKFLRVSAFLAFGAAATQCAPPEPAAQSPKLLQQPVDLACVTGEHVAYYFNARGYAAKYGGKGRVAFTEIIQSDGQTTIFPGYCSARPSKQKPAPKQAPEKKKEPEKKKDTPRPRFYSDYEQVPV